jgi:hypothetical protein
VEGGPSPGRPQLDTREDVSSDASAIRELDEAGAAREELPGSGTQRRECAAATKEDEPQPVPGEPLGHVAAVEEEQLEQSPRALPPNAERTWVEASHDATPYVEVDDDPDAQADPDAAHAERPRREKHERRMVTGLGPARRLRAHVEDGFPARPDEDPLWTETEPFGRASGGSHLRLATQGAREACPRDVDEQRPSSGVPDGDRGGRGSPERQP